MNPFRINCSLRLRHPYLDPDDISNALEIVPFRKWKAGERRTTRDGKNLEGRNKETYWCSEVIAGKGSELIEVLDAYLDKLENKKSFLAECCATGGCLEVFVGWFADATNTGAVLDSELLKRLGDLQINLSLDIYGEDDPDQRRLASQGIGPEPDL